FDPLRSAQWALDELGFESARSAVDPSAVTVAVVDTGVDADHEDLAGTVLPGWDAISETPGGDTDAYGHGTHVAGIIAALAGTGGDVALAAPGSSILAPCPAGDQICGGSTSGYARLSGTSMAAPYVSAAAALLRAARPGASPAQVRAWLTSTATDAGAPGRD